MNKTLQRISSLDMQFNPVKIVQCDIPNKKIMIQKIPQITAYSGRLTYVSLEQAALIGFSIRCPSWSTWDILTGGMPG